jgi:hypothetical protein
MAAVVNPAQSRLTFSPQIGIHASSSLKPAMPRMANPQESAPEQKPGRIGKQV